MKLALLAAAALAVASPAFAATTTFTDEAMLLSNYAFTTYKPNAGFSTTIYQEQGTGFGSDKSIGTVYSKTGESGPGVRFQALSTSFVYDPSVDGAITSIDTSLDHLTSIYYNYNLLSVSALQLKARLLAKQDGKLYEALRETSTAAQTNIWTTASVAGFTAADFFLFDPLNPYADRTQTGLDFGGGAITFGFEITPFFVTLAGGAPSTGYTSAIHAVDNFTVTVNSAGLAAVPEPATWAMMIVGFGLAGTAVRRRRPTFA